MRTISLHFIYFFDSKFPLKMKVITALFTVLPIVKIVSAFEIPEGLCTVSLNKITGGWFELASSDYIGSTLEAGCKCPVAYYSTNKTNPDNIDVSNSCIRYGNFWKVQGYAAPAKSGSKGNLHVTITTPYSFPSNENSSNYNILKIWKDEYEDYTHALVGGDTENFWWLLGRSPWNNETVLQNSFHVLLSYGYNTTAYRTPEQDCVFLGGHDGVNLVRGNN